MNNKQKVLIIIGILAIIGLSFFIGLFVGQNNIQKNDSTVTPVQSETFYARIENIEQFKENLYILINGLEVNDINFRGQYEFKVEDNIYITWRGTKVKASDLKIGMNISVTFTDEALDMVSPTPLEKVIKIEILDDEI